MLLVLPSRVRLNANLTRKKVPGAVFSQCLTRLTRTLCNFWISWFDMVLNTLRGVIKGQKEDHKQHRKH